MQISTIRSWAYRIDVNDYIGYIIKFISDWIFIRLDRWNQGSICSSLKDVLLHSRMVNNSVDLDHTWFDRVQQDHYEFDCHKRNFCDELIEKELNSSMETYMRRDHNRLAICGILTGDVWFCRKGGCRQRCCTTFRLQMIRMIHKWKRIFRDQTLYYNQDQSQSDRITTSIHQDSFVLNKRHSFFSSNRSLIDILLSISSTRISHAVNLTRSNIP